MFDDGYCGLDLSKEAKDQPPGLHLVRIVQYVVHHAFASGSEFPVEGILGWCPIQFESPSLREACVC